MEKQADVEGRTEDREDGYDAIAAGSGYDGSVASCQMSMVGTKVFLFEKGWGWKAEDLLTVWRFRQLPGLRTGT